MSNFNIPPHIQAIVDQQNAQLRDWIEEDLKLYREHITEAHDGEPHPCARTGIMLRHLPGGEAHLGELHATALAAYAVERLVILERELARRIDAAQ
ncbi:hypothetical protein [Mycolicibacterium llatzerense]|uniref:hypothetical protein n=1 Tax=Mycolicibacterium llatzerense TaxID=280871 RepID=UPI0021B4E5F2|nr:hypothetical protein [Mycolicibacterium llatzerense]MCT7372726.1 hypothetical protein [Mycolicibacterium llatzerense]